MKVRLARPEDAEALAHVHVETWRDTYAGILPDRVLLGMSKRREQGGWSGAVLRGERIYVSETEDRGITGFGSCGTNRIRNMPCGAEVYTLYVLPDHQGRGHGKALFLRMLRELSARHYESVLVWVLRDNPARFFYEAQGGERLAEREEHLWGASVPQVAYRWSLPRPDRV